MQKFPHYTKEQMEVPRPPRRRSAKGSFLAICAVLSAIYLIFSFALNAAYADPPTSPYTPGETLSPTCSPTSTDCTVDPPLFSTTTLPMGGILYMNDNSGTVTAATTSLYWNATTSQFQVGMTPTTNASGSVFLLGPNLLEGGNVSGTYIAVNATTSFNGDFLDFQINSSTKFKVASSGALTVSSTAFSVFTNLSSTQFTFTNATGSGNFQIANLHTTAALSASTTLNVQGTSTFFGRMAIGTSSFVGGTSTVVICPLTTCTASSTASTTNTVLWVGSVGNAATGNSITAKGSIASGQSDVGEYVPVVGDDSDYGQGEVLDAVESSSPLFGPSQMAYDPNIAGVVTITAGLIAGGGTDHGTTVIALAGRVPVNVTMDNGPISTGDYLAASDIPGVAMRATQPGRVLGMALTDDFGDPNDPNATSQVTMLVNPGWNLGSLTSTAEIASSSWAMVGTDPTGQPILDQFTAYVQAALAKLGVAIESGVATLQGVIANTVNTNELCVQGVCVNGTQFGAMMSGVGDGNDTSTAPAVVSSAVVLPTPSSTPLSSSTSTPTSTPAASTPAPTSTPPASTPPVAPPPVSQPTSSDSSSSSSTDSSTPVLVPPPQPAPPAPVATSTPTPTPAPADDDSSSTSSSTSE